MPNGIKYIEKLCETCVYPESRNGKEHEGRNGDITIEGTSTKVPWNFKRVPQSNFSFCE